MVDRTLDEVRRRFERDAQSFDAIYRLERSPLSRWFNRIFRKAVFDRYDVTFREAGDVSGKNVLDIGCGSGVYSVDFARRGAAKVTGIDFAENMLRLARQEAAEHGVADRCQFVQMDFLDAQLPREYDVTIAVGVFDYLPDPVTFLAKMKSVTRGRIIATFPGHSLIRKRARKLRYALTRRGTVFFYSEARVREVASAAGLTKFQLVRLSASGGGYVLVADV